MSGQSSMARCCRTSVGVSVRERTYTFMTSPNITGCRDAIADSERLWFLRESPCGPLRTPCRGIISARNRRAGRLITKKIFQTRQTNCDIRIDLRSTRAGLRRGTPWAESRAGDGYRDLPEPERRSARVGARAANLTREAARRHGHPGPSDGVATVIRLHAIDRGVHASVGGRQGLCAGDGAHQRPVGPSGQPMRERHLNAAVSSTDCGAVQRIALEEALGAIGQYPVTLVVEAHAHPIRRCRLVVAKRSEAAAFGDLGPASECPSQHGPLRSIPPESTSRLRSSAASRTR